MNIWYPKKSDSKIIYLSHKSKQKCFLFMKNRIENQNFEAINSINNNIKMLDRLLSLQR